MRLVYVPPTAHRCDRTQLPLDDRPGTVWACLDCDQTWVAVASVLWRLGYLTWGTTWEREGRLARWWREWRTP